MIILHVIPFTSHLIHLQYKSGRKKASNPWRLIEIQCVDVTFAYFVWLPPWYWISESNPKLMGSAQSPKRARCQLRFLVCTTDKRFPISAGVAGYQMSKMWTCRSVFNTQSMSNLQRPLWARAMFPFSHCLHTKLYSWKCQSFIGTVCMMMHQWKSTCKSHVILMRTE